jgi:hypothetical protein
MTTYRVISSPFEEPEELPWEYEEDALISWVDEVFLEGYKNGLDSPFPSLHECLQLLEGSGYQVEALDG